MGTPRIFAIVVLLAISAFLVVIIATELPAVTTTAALSTPAGTPSPTSIFADLTPTPTAEVSIIGTLACSYQSTTYQNEIKLLIERWDDASAIARSSSRMTLATPVAELQAIKREADHLDVPTCLIDAHFLLKLAMDSTIHGFLAFMSQESDSSVKFWFDLGTEQIDNYKKLVIEATGALPVFFQ